MAISAAAVGVGARRSEAKSISVVSVSCPTAEISGMRQAAAARTTISSLNAIRSSRLPPPRATISTSGPGDRSARLDRVEPGDGGGDLSRRALALHRHRPEQDGAREAPGDGGLDVLDHRALFAGDHADHPGQHRERPLALGIEQALGAQALLQHLDLRQQRAGAGVFHPLDDQLVGRPLAIGRKSCRWRSPRRRSPAPCPGVERRISRPRRRSCRLRPSARNRCGRRGSASLR